MPSVRRSRPVRRIAALALLACAGLAACGDDAYVVAEPPGSNAAVVGQSAGRFGFAVQARGWTFDQTYTAELRAATLAVGLAVGGYRGGTGSVTVTDSAGTVVFARDLAGNVAQGNTVVRGRPPHRVRIVAANWAGSLSLGVTDGATAR